MEQPRPSAGLAFDPTKEPHPSLPKPLYYLRYILMHDTLYLGPKMTHIIPNSTHDNTICYTCATPASAEHCFLECPIAALLWTEAQRILDTIPDNGLDIENWEKLFGPASTKTDAEKILEIITGSSSLANTLRAMSASINETHYSHPHTP